MAKRKIVLLDEKGSPWEEFLKEFFEDTPSEVRIFHEGSSAHSSWEHFPPDVAFIREKLLTLSFSQRLKVWRESRPDFRLFEIGDRSKTRDTIPFDGRYPASMSLSDFQKDFVQYLPLPETICVLVVDDEKETGTMIRDFFGGRVRPAFEVRYAENGEEGLKAIELKRPDVLILDLKMPVLSGREMYRILREKKIDIPAIIYFDSVFGDEMADIYQFGRPSVVEKGAPLSAMPEMMALIKKMAYFG